MATNEELIQAAKLLKENCDNLHCTECVFYVRPTYNCALCAGKSPTDWTITKPRRWTDADIQLAKALKAFGAKFVARQVDSYACDARSGKSSGDFICTLPVGSFKSVQGLETVSVDDILKEDADER